MARLKRIKTTQPKPNGNFLIIFQGNGYLKGDVRNVRFPKVTLMSARFYEEDGDASEYRVKEYFNF